MRKKKKVTNVLGPRLEHVVQRTFAGVTGKRLEADGDSGSNCSGGGADCANCGNCSNN
jgi:hypothetical protein